MSDESSEPQNESHNQESHHQELLKTTPSLFTTAINIFVAPTEAFNEINQRPSILFPTALLIVTYLAFYTWYFYAVDFTWLVDQMLARMQDNTTEELDATRKAFESMSNVGMGVTNNISITIMLLLMFAAQAGYLAIVSSFQGDEFKFKQWFSLASWTSLPALLVVLTGTVSLIMSNNGQVSIYDLNALSLSNLGFSADGNSTLQSLFETLSLVTIWSLSLLVLAYQQWVKVELSKAALIILTPHILIYGIWASIGLFS